MEAEARVEVVREGLSQAVREFELAESSRAAAVARAQQLLAQASAIDDPPAVFLLLPCDIWWLCSYLELTRIKIQEHEHICIYVTALALAGEALIAVRT